MTYSLIYHLDGYLFLGGEFLIIRWPRLTGERVRPDAARVVTRGIEKDCPQCRIRGPPKLGRVLARGLFFCLKTDFRLLYNPINLIC